MLEGKLTVVTGGNGSSRVGGAKNEPFLAGGHNVCLTLNQSHRFMALTVLSNQGQQEMTRQWQAIDSQVATQHPLYGVKGWPVVLSISIFLDLFRVLSPLADEANSAGMNLFQFFRLAYPEIVFAKIFLTLNGAAALVIAWLLFTRHRKFRITASALLIGCWPTAAALSAALGVPELSEALAESFLPWFISSVVWVTYLQRSRQVRVTFEHCVLVGDAGRTVQLQ